MSNIICFDCRKEIKDGATYYIRIEPGEQPSILCELCTGDLT
jgi:uncharacterized CHY-type Zn-finger protein